MPVSSPNYTQIPNDLIDAMPQMGEAEFRVVMIIARQTFGWQKKRDRISLSQIVEKTGLSKQGAVNAIDAAIKNGWINRYPVGQSFEYEVNVLDQSTNLTSQRSRLELVNVVDKLGEKLVNVVDTQKKVLNKTQKKITANAENPKPPANDLYPIAEALAYVCKMSLEANGGRLFAEAKLLAKAVPQPTPDLIKTHYNGNPSAFWRSKDWRGRKGAFPTPAQVRETWAQAVASGSSGWEGVDTEDLQGKLDRGEI